jgi:putative lipoic acid-binding regulatory protein
MTDTLLKFPCEFPLKVVGDSTFDIEDLVRTTLDKNLSHTQDIEITVRESSAGKYTSVTALFIAQDKAELDSIYTKLSGHDKVKMVL